MKYIFQSWSIRQQTHNLTEKKSQARIVCCSDKVNPGAFISCAGSASFCGPDRQQGAQQTASYDFKKALVPMRLPGQLVN